MNDTELKNEYRKEADTWKRLYKESQAGLGTLGAQLETARIEAFAEAVRIADVIGGESNWHDADAGWRIREALAQIATGQKGEK